MENVSVSLEVPRSVHVQTKPGQTNRLSNVICLSLRALVFYR